MNKICHIVGGGPSLLGFNWRSLDGEFCVAVNDAFKVLPGASVVFFSIGDWADKNFRALIDHKGIKVGASIYPDETTSLPGFLSLRLTKGEGLERRPGCVAGRCSGQMAINFAVTLGFREIWLYGFDMGRDERLATHWHGDALFQSSDEDYSRYAAAIDALAPALARRGVKVWNLSPTSRLTAYPKAAARVLTKPDQPSGRSERFAERAQSAIDSNSAARS